MKTMRLIVLGLLVMVAVTATGCATMRNTPAQDLALERWQTCDHFATVNLERIDLDGRIVVTAYEHEVAPFTACVREAAAGQRGREAGALPQALVLVKLFGCQGGAS